jgi:hypothetical protein
MQLGYPTAKPGFLVEASDIGRERGELISMHGRVLFRKWAMGAAMAPAILAIPTGAWGDTLPTSTMTASFTFPLQASSYPIWAFILLLFFGFTIIALLAYMVKSLLPRHKVLGLAGGGRDRSRAIGDFPRRGSGYSLLPLLR